MTRDDMLTIVEHCIHGADSKGVMECSDIQASRQAIEEFLVLVGDHIITGIRMGVFDE